MSVKTRVSKRTKHLNRSFAGNVGVTIVLGVFGWFMLMPMLYTIAQSLKPLDELWVFPPRFIRVNNPTLGNYQDLFRLLNDSMVPFSRYLFNTVIISVVGTFGHVILASMCAYALSKHKFPGSKVMFQIVVTALLFNGTVLQIPNFMMITWLNLLDSPLALIIPAFGGSLGLYLMKQFMEQMVKDDILEAARIDGAGEMRIFWGIVMPMVKPGWLTLIILSFQGLWNMGPSNVIFSESLKTLNYAMSQILAGGVARAGVGAAASVIMLVVPVTIFIIMQSSVVETMGASGMKE